MSEWVKAKDAARKEAKEMEKSLKGYSYKDRESAGKTDTEYRKAVAGHINASRDLIFPMIESAYLEKDFESAGALEEVMQWLDVFLLELGLKLEWRDDAGYRDFVTLIRSDFTLLQNAGKLEETIGRMKKDALGGRGRSVVKRCTQLREYVSDLMFVFKKRRHSLGG